MPYFTNADTLRLVEHLALTPSQKIALENRQVVYYNAYGDAGVVRIQTILDQFDEIEESIAATAIDGNSQLKKASSLEWFGAGEGRFTRLDNRRGQLVAKLIAMLDLGAFVGGGGITYVGRS